MQRRSCLHIWNIPSGHTRFRICIMWWGSDLNSIYSTLLPVAKCLANTHEIKTTTILLDHALGCTFLCVAIHWTILRFSMTNPSNVEASSDKSKLRNFHLKYDPFLQWLSSKYESFMLFSFIVCSRRMNEPNCQRNLPSLTYAMTVRVVDLEMFAAYD